MTEPETTLPDANEPAEPRIRRTHPLSSVWILPLVALLLAGWLGFRAWRDQGPLVSIVFASAEGLEAGQTKVRYKDVDVGKVETIRLTGDGLQVEVRARLSKDVAFRVGTHTRFWVVKARIAASGVSGLSTLLSGAYIGMDPGIPGSAASTFQGLESPPIITTSERGKSFTLRADKLGSLNVGSPVYHRQIKVGEVAGYQLEKGGQAVEIQVFIRESHMDLVRKDSRFWNAGGVDVTVDTSGIRMAADSLLDMLLGGVAFENPMSLEASGPAEAGQTFVLYPSHEKIYEKVYLKRYYYVLQFNESVHGLSRGAAVEFRGIRIGQVEDLKLEFDSRSLEGRIPVLIALEPERMSILGPNLEGVDGYIQKLVSKGLRAQLKMGSMLTGSLFVDLDFLPQATPRAMVRYGRYAEIPTIPTTMGALLTNLSAFLDRLQKLPLDDLAQEARTLLPALKAAADQARGLMAQADRETLPQLKASLAQFQRTLEATERLASPGSPLQKDLRRALEELTQAARSLKELADALERRPESLVFGKGKHP